MRIALLSLYWTIVAGALLIDGNWTYSAYVRSHQELESLVGRIGSARMIGFSPEPGLGDGMYLWNFDVSAADAQRLRARCRGPGYIQKAGERVAEIVAPSSSESPPQAISMPPASGCLVAYRTDPADSSSFSVVLDGTLLQLTRRIGNP